jgi:hypothetical protein
MSKNIVHQYFKKDMGDAKLLLKFNPVYLTGSQLTIRKNEEPTMDDVQFEDSPAELEKTLLADGYMAVNAMEYNLYLSGLL